MRKLWYRILRKLDRPITLRPKGTLRGWVLVSYLTEPLAMREVELGTHSNLWESREIVRAFLERGYGVDVIDWTNRRFVPKKPYRCVVDIHSNLERFTPLLPATCVKVFHATNAHWEYQNQAEQRRLDSLALRRGAHISPKRVLAPSHATDVADVITILGNEFTQETYAYAKKPIVRIPISTTHQFPFSNRAMAQARKNFVWVSGAGMVLKGLDLVLEAFAQMPEYHLSVFANVSGEADFAAAYHKELYELPNIVSYGKKSLASAEFQDAIKESIGIIFVSASEGGGGSVITGMHAGLIPIVSRESSVDVGSFGIVLSENSVQGVTEAVRKLAEAPAEELEVRSKAAWDYARSHHTREAFAKAYRAFVASILESPSTSHE